MTTAQQGPWARYSPLVAHFLPTFILMMVAYSMGNWVGVRYPMWVTLIMMISYMIILAIAVIHMHSTSLCVRCIQNVPLDPQTSVQRRLWFLWVFHKIFMSRWGIPIYLVFLWTVPFTLRFVVTGEWVGQPGTNGWSLIPTDIMTISIAYGIWSHHRLEPWCPWCRWGGGGGCDDCDCEPVPDPDPAEAAKRS